VEKFFAAGHNATMAEVQPPMSSGEALEQRVRAAVAGDRDAVEAVVLAVRDVVYRLALRMMWDPDDAADATQEILIKIVTRLATFRGDSAFRTWVYRVACNHLLGARQRRARAPSRTALPDDADGDLALIAAAGADARLLAEEVKLGCSHAMLHVLDREHRLAYILGELLELAGAEAAAVLDITPAAYRQRLTRARARIREVMQAHCGLVEPANPCRCERQIGPAMRGGWVDADRLRFATHPRRPDAGPRAQVEAIEQLHATVAVFRSHPDYAAPDAVVAGIRDLLRAPPFSS
jgi:RNA polymerase sigma factor (sigma-70 family)